MDMNNQNQQNQSGNKPIVPQGEGADQASRPSKDQTKPTDPAQADRKPGSAESESVEE